MYKAVFDTETTGLLVPSANSLDEQPYIMEIHITVIDDEFQLVREYGTFIKPPVPLSAEITRITGVTNEMVADAPPFIKVWKDIADAFLGCEVMVGHNLAFDRSMLANELLRIDKVLNFPWPMEHICTVEKSMSIEQRRMSLANLHTLVTGKPHDGAHRAKSDVYATIRCLHYLVEKGLA